MVKLFQPELSEAQKALLNTNGICIWPEIKSEATQVSEGQFLVYSKTHIAFMYEGFAYINEVYSEQRATVPDGTLRLEETRER